MGAPGSVAVSLPWPLHRTLKTDGRAWDTPLCADSTKGCRGRAVSALEDGHVALGWCGEGLRVHCYPWGPLWPPVRYAIPLISGL